MQLNYVIYLHYKKLKAQKDSAINFLPFTRGNLQSNF